MAQLLESWPCFGTNNCIFVAMKGLFCIGLIVIFAGSCIEHRPNNPVVKQEVTVPTPENVNQLKGKRVYKGKIPCADCSGIEQQLVLRGDTTGVFRLTEVYRDATEDGDEVLVTTGSWKYYTNKAKQKVLFLSEGSLKDSSRIQRYRVEKTAITQLDFNGEWIKSTHNYQLKLVSKR
jgi:copper homeostasis protein (lipoprotein)